MPAATEEPLILYLHIPKAGGTTLSECLFRNHKADKYHVAENNYLHAGIYYFPIGFFKDADLDVPREVRRALCRDDIRVVTGHFCFGIHEIIRKPCTYITVLRNPVERIVSLYHHLHMHKVMSLLDFMDQMPYRELDNDQVRRISGKEPPIGGCTHEMLAAAKYNLTTRFSVVGVTERFDDTLLLLKHKLEWNDDLLYYPKNTNPGRPKVSKLLEDETNAILAKNRLDMLLYQFAAELMDSLIAQYGEKFAEEREELRRSKRDWIKEIKRRDAAKKAETNGIFDVRT